MELKLFTDLVDALGKVAGGLKAIVNVPKTERENIRKTVDETYRLIDTTLNMVIIRFGDVLLREVDAEFLREVAQLDNYQAWLNGEREFRLCRSLRVALRDMNSLAGKVAAAVSASDWRVLLDHMELMLATEGELAMVISGLLQQHADKARATGEDAQKVKSVRDALAASRAALIAERQRLIQHELELYDAL